MSNRSFKVQGFLTQIYLHSGAESFLDPVTGFQLSRGEHGFNNTMYPDEVTCSEYFVLFYPPTTESETHVFPKPQFKKTWVTSRQAARGRRWTELECGHVSVLRSQSDLTLYGEGAAVDNEQVLREWTTSAPAE